MGLFDQIREERDRKKLFILWGGERNDLVSESWHEFQRVSESTSLRGVVSQSSRVREWGPIREILRRIQDAQTKSKERSALLQDIRTWKITLPLSEIRRLERDLDATKNTTFIRQLLDALRKQIGSPSPRTLTENTGTPRLRELWQWFSKKYEHDKIIYSYEEVLGEVQSLAWSVTWNTRKSVDKRGITLYLEDGSTIRLKYVFSRRNPNKYSSLIVEMWWKIFNRFPWRPVKMRQLLNLFNSYKTKNGVSASSILEPEEDERNSQEWSE